MRSIHWVSGRRNTGWLPRSLRPSAVTSSLASTVPSAGHQFTSASSRYARRYESTTVAALRAVEVVPRHPFRVGIALRRARAVLELLEQLVDRAGAVLDVVVPGIEELEEDPLRPAVVVDVGGGDAPPRVVPEAERPQLAPHVGDVRLGGDPRVLAGLHRVLLGREAEGVVAHRVQHVVAAHAHEARVDVGADVAERMTHVEARTTRVREHVEHVELPPVGDRREPVVELAAGVRRPEGALRLPSVLPLRLDLVGERGVVAELRDLGGGADGIGHARRAYRAEIARPALVSWPSLAGL